MPKTRTIIGNDIAIALVEYELLLDQALAKGAALAGMLPEARINAKVAAATGQNAIEQIFLSLNRLTEGRRAVVEGHAHLNATRIELRVPVTAGGDGERCPDPGGHLIEAAPTLSLVA